MDNLFNKLFQKMSPSEIKYLMDLQASGAIKIDESALPTHMRYNEEEKTILNVMRAIIKAAVEGESPEQLAELTEGDLKNMFSQFNTNKRQQPDNYIDSPAIFGHADLGPDDIEEWRNYRRDMRECGEIESALSFVTKYHEKAAFRFNEESLIANLHIVLPMNTLRTLNSLKSQKMDLADIYKELSNNFGGKASNEQTIEALNRVADTTGSAQDKLNAIKNIVLKSNFSPTIQTIALHEARRVVRTCCGNHTLKMIDLMLPGGPPTFNEFCHTAKTHFLQELEMKPKSRLHNVNTNHDETTETNTLLLQVVKLLSDSHIHNHSMPMVNHTVDQPRCYSCNAYGHFSRDCYKNRFRRNNGFRDHRNNLPLPYSDRICNVHKRGHTNKNCYVQKIPCTSHKEHTAPHMQGECQRRNDLPPSPQHNRTNYGDRERATYQWPQTHPPLQQTNHIRNSTAAAQNADMVKNLTDILNQAIGNLTNGQA